MESILSGERLYKKYTQKKQKNASHKEKMQWKSPLSQHDGASSSTAYQWDIQSSPSDRFISVNILEGNTKSTKKKHTKKVYTMQLRVLWIYLIWHPLHMRHADELHPIQFHENQIFSPTYSCKKKKNAKHVFWRHLKKMRKTRKIKEKFNRYFVASRDASKHQSNRK